MSGEAPTTLFYELSRNLSCPRCPGDLIWCPDYDGPGEVVTPEKLYGIVKGSESMGDRPIPEAVAAMLCTYRIERVQMHGPALKALELEGGVVLELGISVWGAYVTRIIRKTTTEGEEDVHTT